MSTSILDYKPSGLSNLDPEFKELWISWLRYGNLRQVKGCLKRKREDGRIGYCCLGVAADCVDPNGWGKYYNISFDESLPHYFKGEAFSLPQEVLYKIGLHNEDQNTLADMNDAGIGFKRIARWIEKNL